MVRLTNSTISMVWVMPSGISFLQSMRLNGTLYTLIKNLTHLGQKSLRSLLREQTPPTMATRKILWNRFRLQSIKFRHFRPFRLKLRRKSMSSKLHIKMTTKGPSRKQVIIPMSSENVISFIKSSSLHVANIDRLLCNAKSDVLVDYICSDNTGITVITSKVTQQSNISIINQYVKNSNDINSLQVEEPRLPKSKSYLKIIGIPFFPHVNSQEKLTSNDIEMILKQNHIFDNISLVSKPRLIKVSPKSDMSIVWLDIWDVQSSNNAKMLSNRCFNVRNYIATIWGANMNPGVPQCKNCWKWGHATFSCRIQGAKCVKCNGSHKSKHHREFGWCCKANAKFNLPRLETKKGEPCPHSFKCLNCHRDHQADSNQCPFWRHRFNREWHQRKYAEIRENRSKSICSDWNGTSHQWLPKTSKSFRKTFARTLSLSISSLKH